jgi:hypothetical protein
MRATESIMLVRSHSQYISFRNKRTNMKEFLIFFFFSKRMNSLCTRSTAHTRGMRKKREGRMKPPEKKMGGVGEYSLSTNKTRILSPAPFLPAVPNTHAIPTMRSSVRWAAGGNKPLSTRRAPPGTISTSSCASRRT